MNLLHRFFPLFYRQNKIPSELPVLQYLDTILTSRPEKYGETFKIYKKYYLVLDHDALPYVDDSNPHRL